MTRAAVRCNKSTFPQALRAVAEALFAEPEPLFHPDPWEHREAAPAIPEDA